MYVPVYPPTLYIQVRVFIFSCICTSTQTYIEKRHVHQKQAQAVWLQVNPVAVRRAQTFTGQGGGEELSLSYSMFFQFVFWTNQILRWYFLKWRNKTTRRYSLWPRGPSEERSLDGLVPAGTSSYSLWYHSGPVLHQSRSLMEDQLWPDAIRGCMTTGFTRFLIIVRKRKVLTILTHQV